VRKPSLDLGRQVWNDPCHFVGEDKRSPPLPRAEGSSCCSDQGRTIFPPTCQNSSFLPHPNLS
jgi:hypothetical protein